jgi:hypothetical protein
VVTTASKPVSLFDVLGLAIFLDALLCVVALVLSVLVVAKRLLLKVNQAT